MTNSKSSEDAQSQSLPGFAKRGLPSQLHHALEPLAGTFSVDKQIYVATGTRENPATSSGMLSRRKWIGASAKHLLDVTEGSLGRVPYYRLGVLGFSNVDQQYEFSTFDGVNANMMIYRSATIDKPSHNIVMTGVFTDQGLIGEQTAGKHIPMRTLIAIEDQDRHVIELYFTPPGQDELLIDRSVYVRTKD